MAVEAKGKTVVSVEEELALQAKTAAALERPIGGAVSLRGGIISWQGAPVALNRLQAVIVDSIFENRWYNKPFNADQPVNPACFALAREEKELAPHDDSEEAQGSPAQKLPTDPPVGMCFGCPKNAWKSDPRGGRGKACSQSRRLVLIPVTALESEKSVRDAEVAILKVPVTSVRYWSAYVNVLSTTKQRPVYSVATEIYTELHPKHQFHLHFNMLFPVKNEMIGALREKIKQVESLLMAPYAIGQNATETDTGAVKQQKF